MTDKANKNQTFNRKWPIFFWFGSIFCFFIFPIFLFEEGIRNILQTRKEVAKQELFEKLNNRLEQLLKYKEPSHYLHSLLKIMSARAKSSEDPIAYLKKAIPHLKKRNPEIFKFAVWDGKGKIIRAVTDFKGYRYILKTMFEVFKATKSECEKNYPGFPENLPLVDKKLNLLRSFLGQFLIPESLRNPYLRGSLGRTILASSEPDKAYFWYQIEKDFGLFCAIDNKELASTRGVKSVVKLLNGNNTDGIKTGIVEIAGKDKIFAGVEESRKREILLEIGKFENVSEQQLETKNLLLLIKLLNPFVRSFTYVEKSGRVPEIQKEYWFILSSMILLMTLSGLGIFWTIFKSKKIFSIRWKLILLFAYANGLPLLILGFLGYEYLQQKSALLVNKAHNAGYVLLSDFDSKFTRIKKNFADHLNKEFARINRETQGLPSVYESLQRLRETTQYMNYHDFYVVNESGKTNELNGSMGKSTALVKTMGGQLIDYLNEREFTPKEKIDTRYDENQEIRAVSFTKSRAMIYDLILHKIGVLIDERMGTDQKVIYWNSAHSLNREKFTHMIAIFWKQESLQGSYLQHYINDLNINQDGFKCFAMLKSNGLVYPENTKANSQLASLFQQAFNSKIARSELTRLDNKNYVAFAAQGKLLNDVALVALYPREQIDKIVRKLKLQLIIFALLSFSLTTGIGRILASQFLEPVRDLGIGVKEIGKQNFKHRIPVKSEDEFGKLGTVFNHAIESLQELEVAKVVQDNLFPAQNLKHNSLEVFGKSVSMTRLGGDYYDFFAINEDKAGVLMGDVAGHGVPAALIMAMAKASVLISENEKTDPASMLSYLHKVIRSVKSKTIKRMMTCQYFCFDSNSGFFEFANAGHCFPLLIKKDGLSIEDLHLVGTPLGITKKAVYKNQSGQMESGDVILLYTDGMIESKNSAGKEMGFNGFTEMVKSSHNEKLEVFYQNIYDSYLKWSPIAEDDITMVLIQFQQEPRNV